MIRSMLMVLVLSSCHFNETQSPLGPEPKQCTDLETALQATRTALDENRFELLGRVVREVFVEGRLSTELRQQLSDPESLEQHLEGNHLRSLVGVILEAMAEVVPVQTLQGLQDILAQEEALAGIFGFMDERPARWDVLDPVREMFTSCRDGGDLADLLVELPMMEGACGEPELLCSVDHLVVVLKSPDLADALSSVDFEGRLGREAFQHLIIHIMDVTATPGFDPDALAEQVRRLFGERLDATTLQALDGLMASFGRFMEDPSIQQPWGRIVACVKRYDPDRTVSGLTYDMLIEGGLNSGRTARVLAETKAGVDGRRMMTEWSRIAALLAEDSGLRERLSLGLRPMFVPTLLRLISPRLVELQERGVLEEWVRWVQEGLPCEE